MAAGRVEDEVPALLAPRLRQREPDGLVVGVEQHQRRVADDALALAVELLEQVAGQPHAEAVHETGPVAVAHRAPRRHQPGHVRHVRAADHAPVKEPAPLEHRLALPQLDDTLDIGEQRAPLVVEIPVEP